MSGLEGIPAPPPDERWWQNAVIYEIYVRSFADGNGDGIGDLIGIRRRLPALAELGVDAVWLTPFYPSPMVDGGYDVADYCDVDPTFGTLADFDALLADAHSLGLRVIVDIVPNHTSSAHPWFRRAVHARRGSAEREYYIFRDGRGDGGREPPADWVSIFGGPAWEPVGDGQWYLHLFAREQPDLNWANPAVREEFERILCFWLDRGVDGFRIDVAHGLVKELVDPLPALGELAVDQAAFRGLVTDHPLWDRDGVHEIYRRWRKILDTYRPPRIAVAESWAPPHRLSAYIRPDELHQAFNFAFLRAPWNPDALRDVIDDSLQQAGSVGALPTWVIANHDVVRPASRYALPPQVDPDAWLASNGTFPEIDLATGLQRARAAALLMLALPGAAYVYQGDELGLEEVADLPADVLADPIWRRTGGKVKGRDGCRVPLPWEPAGPSLGFGPTSPWLPQPPQWAKKAWSVQRRDPTSTLSLYCEALRLRRHFPPVAAVTWVDAGPQVLAFRRGEGLLCVVNFSTRPIALPPGRLILRSDRADGGHLPPDTAAWLVPE